MRARAALVVLLWLALACANTPPRQLNLYPSETPDATATSAPTQTPFLVHVVVTGTPEPTPSPTEFVSYPATVKGAWNCRAAPDLASKTLAYLADGQRVTVIGRDGAWLKITTDRSVCFISGVAVK